MTELRHIDLVQAREFLAALDPVQDRFVFQTFDDTPAKNSILARVVAGTLDLAAPTLQSVSDQGAGVCVQINAGIQRAAAKITGVRAVFVDLDSLHAATLKEIASCMPPPTAVVCSSPGKHHIYWRVVDCPLDQFRAAQLRLARAFRGDEKVTNLDRVMRLPGTWHQKFNPVLTQLIAARGVAYSLGELMAACAPAATTYHVLSPPLSRQQVTITGAMVMASEKFVLPETIGQGDRVNTLVRLIGQMAALGYGLDSIEQEVRRANQELCKPPIGESELVSTILSAAHRYTERAEAETRARVLTPEAMPASNVPPPAADGTPTPTASSEDFWSGGDDGFSSGKLTGDQTQRLNDFLRRYVLIEDSSQVGDLESVSQKTDLLGLAEFKVAKMNQRIGDTQLASNWLMSPARKSAASTIYYPSTQRLVALDGAVYWNGYRPAATRPADTLDKEKIEVFREHISFLFGVGSAAELYFLSWFAFTVQRPEIRVPWAPLLVSSPRVGKGWLYLCLQKLLGDHNCAMITSDDIGERKGIYNEWMSGTTLVCIDEMDSGSKWGDMNRLKGLITESYQVVNHKYGGKKKERCYPNFLCFSNVSNAAAITVDDGRFWVHRVENRRHTGAGYYDRLFDWLETDGPSHLLRKCLDMDLSAFAYGQPPPMTLAKKEMIAETTSEIEQIIQDGIDTNTGVFAADVVSIMQVHAYALAVLGLDKVPESMRWQMRAAVAKCTRKLAVDRYTVQQQGKPIRVELRAVRSFTRWCAADAAHASIIGEYRRATEFEFGRPTLKSVEK